MLMPAGLLPLHCIGYSWLHELKAGRTHPAEIAMLRRLFSRPQSSSAPSSSAPSAMPAAPVAASVDADDLHSLREVYLTLFEVQRSHELIDVAIDGSSAHYQSIILGVDPERGTVTIDELFPPGFVGLPGQRVTISVRLDGSRRMSFTTHITARQADGRDIDSYFLALPENIEYNQRRGAFRLQLGQGMLVTSEFVAPDQQSVSARIRDLSSTGVRLELLQPLPLKEGDVLQDLKFDFAGRSFHCVADVRNLRSTKDAKEALTVGAVFRDLPRAEQRSLERMIMQRQRQQAQTAVL